MKKIKNEKNRIFLITWTTYNTRIPQVINYHPQKGKSLWLDDHSEILITKLIKEILQENNLKCFSYNICKNHLHIVLSCRESQLPFIIRKIKRNSLQKYKFFLGISSQTKINLWDKKYRIFSIRNREELENSVNYVKNSRKRCLLSNNVKLNFIIENMVY